MRKLFSVSVYLKSNCWQIATTRKKTNHREHSNPSMQPTIDVINQQSTLCHQPTFPSTPQQPQPQTLISLCHKPINNSPQQNNHSHVICYVFIFVFSAAVSTYKKEKPCEWICICICCAGWWMGPFRPWNLLFFHTSWEKNKKLTYRISHCISDIHIGYKIFGKN